jgi:hypothetical protein
MIGVVLIVVAVVLAIPVGVMLAGAVWSALVGWSLTDDADERADGQPA